MITYKEAGVDIGAADELVRRISKMTGSLRADNVLAGVGGFSSLVRIPPGLREPVLVSGTDGVGTKLKVAFAAGRHDTVGIDLVAMCVNDVITSGAEPLFFLDYFACGSLDVEVADRVLSGVVEGCRQADCPLVGGETAEMPGMYPAGEYDLAGFAVGVVERDRILTGRDVREGDRVLGLASSGLHSNGYSLVRRLLLERLAMPLDEAVESLGCTLGQELLRPTRIYAREVKALCVAGGVKCLAHITGGGLVENAARNVPGEFALVFKEGSWPVPAVFRLIESSGVGRDEMLRTFNMGVGMIAVVERDAADGCMANLGTRGVEVMEIGHVEKRAGGAPRVRFEK
jgi:phosphoribosylformylglycinamidine cyclo-ligase